MAEHFGFEEFVRDGRAIHGHEVASRADRLRVNRVGNNLFSAATLAGNEHGRVGGGNAADECAQFDDGWVISNEIAFSRQARGCFHEIRPRFHPQDIPHHSNRRIAG